MTPVPAFFGPAREGRDSNLAGASPCVAPWVAWVGLLFLPAGVLRGAQDAPPVALTVFMRDAGQCPVRVLDEMQAETAAILRPAGITLAWRHFPHAGRCDPVPALIVLTFAGTCRGEGRCGQAGRSVALGWTHRTDGEILPFCVVDCDRVRQVVNPAIQHTPVEVRNCLYGRALGRVVAHELYHVIANTTAHASGGLAKPRLSAKELISGQCRFTDVEAAQMRSAAKRGFRMDVGLPAARTHAGQQEQKSTSGK